MCILKKIKKDLRELKCQDDAKSLASFFKTKKGEYGYGDVFLGVTIPKQRQLAKSYCALLTFDKLNKPIENLLASVVHEERMIALLMLVLCYKKANITEQEKIYNLYCTNISRINNWDLVDVSAPHIVGAYLLDKEKKFLYKLVAANNLWERRIAIVSTWYLIRNNLFKETLALAKKLLQDKEDLIHKATGWMLREIGKRDFCILEDFLHKYYKKMPRTMLRYAIEKFPEKLRIAYLNSKI